MNIRLWFSALTVAIIASPVLASGLPWGKPLPAPVLLPPPPLWTGFYAGLNAGYGWGTSNAATTGAFPLVDLDYTPLRGAPFGYRAAANAGVASVNQSGFIGGGQIGYNYQWGPSFVAGLEVDLQGAGIGGSGGHRGIAQFGPDIFEGRETAVGGGGVTAGVDWLGTVRGRMGYLVTPALLAYATGGLAYGGVHATAAHSLAFSVDDRGPYPTFGGLGYYSDTRVGWTVGGGAEWMFMPNWSLKAEALYYRLGSATFASSPVGAFIFDGYHNLYFSNMPVTRVNYDGVIARAGVNYHFNWGAITPSAAAPSAPPAWTGFYAGLNAGYGWGTTNAAATEAFPLVDNFAAAPWRGTPFGFTATANSGVASVDQSGFIGGGQVGYDYQWGAAFLAGLEVDMQGSGIRGLGGYTGGTRFGPNVPDVTVETATGAGVVTAGVDWLGTVRGRLGYLVTPRLLAYATGGLAYGGVHATAAHSLAFSDSDLLPMYPITIYPTFGGDGRYADTRVGWTVGGGGEWMFAPNWSLKAEALYYDLGAKSFASSPVGAIDPDGLNITGVTGAVPFANTPVTRVKYDGVIARAGLNYHFDWGSAPVANF